MTDADGTAPRLRWARARELFEAALDLPPAARPAFLDRACADAPALRAELRALLEAHETLESETSQSGTWLDGLDPRRAGALLDDGVEDPRSGEGRPRETPARIGRFEVLDILGRGGMGVVYLARDPRLNRRVALKLLPRAVSPDHDARRRLEAEARAASVLDHPNLATVHEIGETDEGRLFIALTHYDGPTLRQRLREGPLPLAMALEIAVQVAEGLRAAHRAGVVHRDVKPANLILTPDGTVKLIDFGVADRAGAEAAKGAPAQGTAAYMSPEQAGQGSVDHRTDLWSLGVVLFEMLTGARPFDGETTTDLLHAIRQEAPADLRGMRPDAPEELLHLVQRCLEKDPAGRPASARALVDELRAVQARSVGIPGGQPPAGVRGRGRRAVVAGALVVVAAGAAAWRAALLQGPPPPAPPGSVAVLPFTNVGGDPDARYLSDGVAEDILVALAGVPGLRVVSRTSSFAFRGDVTDVREVGRALGVRHVLEGSVRRQGARIRVAVRLVDASDGYELWTESYDADGADLFAVEDDISRAVAAALERRVERGGTSIVERGTADPMAHDLYLRGRHAAARRTGEGFQQALGYYRRALERDSTYVAALAGMCDAYRHLGTYGIMAEQEAFARAEDAALRALALDPESGEALTSLGGVQLVRGHFGPAEEAFRRAIEVGRSSAATHHWYAFLLATLGRLEESLREVALAHELDPLSLPVLTSEARILLLAGELDAGVGVLESAIDLEPEYPWTHLLLAAARVRQQRLDDARLEAEAALRELPGDARARATLAGLQALTGDVAAARETLSRLSREAEGEGSPAAVGFSVAIVHAALGETDRAFQALENLTWNSELLFSLQSDPFLGPLRADPRYPALLRRLGLGGRNLTP